MHLFLSRCEWLRVRMYPGWLVPDLVKAWWTAECNLRRVDGANHNDSPYTTVTTSTPGIKTS